jgi:hypothetical protein
VPCANQQNQCTNPPGSGTDQDALRIQNARNDAAQGLDWLHGLLDLVDGAYNWFKSSDWGTWLGSWWGLVQGFGDLKGLTQQLIALVQAQLSWSDAMWTGTNVDNIQTQADGIGVLLTLKALAISALLAAVVAVPVIGAFLGAVTVPVALGYWTSVVAGVSADLAATQATLANEQWSLLGL